MILGHAHPDVVAAVQKAASLGLSYGAPCPEKLSLLPPNMSANTPHIKKIRMVNSGTEAAMSAIRLARAATGRNKIIKFDGCYHGHADSLLVKSGSGVLTLDYPALLGYPFLTISANLNCKI